MTVLFYCVNAFIAASPNTRELAVSVRHRPNVLAKRRGLYPRPTE